MSWCLQKTKALGREIFSSALNSRMTVTRIWIEILEVPGFQISYCENPYSKGLYSVTCPSGRVIDGPPKGRYWAISEERFRELDRDNRIWWGKDGNNMPTAQEIFV